MSEIGYFDNKGDTVPKDRAREERIMYFFNQKTAATKISHIHPGIKSICLSVAA